MAFEDGQRRVRRKHKGMCIRQNGKTVSLVVGDIIGKDAYIATLRQAKNIEAEALPRTVLFLFRESLKRVPIAYF